jgi:hypothetical protein
LDGTFSAWLEIARSAFAERTGCQEAQLRTPLILGVLMGMALGPLAHYATAQDSSRPTLRVGRIAGPITLDGTLDEPSWSATDSIPVLTMIEPIEGGVLVGRTTVRVLADADALIIGIDCHDPDASGIVSFSKARDSELENEDHVKLILDTFLDGRSGYVVAVNPSGARYDALVADYGEGENSAWDAVWDAGTARRADGWSVEIRIPVRSLSFRSGVPEWGFNVERRLERLQEVSRWASPVRDAKVTQPSRAGRLQDLPAFSLGHGLTVRPAVVAGFEKPAFDADAKETGEPSLDVFQQLGPDAVASLTVNTDFAETEVDTRQTNLTRFPLFFPEKRTFFLEGADIFDFGIGLRAFRRPDVQPFHSRRIGLLSGQQIPVIVGGKMNGRLGQTNAGAFAVRTGEETLAADGDTTIVAPTTLGAARVKQNVFAESSIGAIATFGDPEGRSGSWMTGIDATFQTSRLWGDKNLLVGAWGLVTDRESLTGDRTAFGGAIDFPNDTWDLSLTYKRIGDGFDPSLSFVPRRSVQLWRGSADWRYRPTWTWVRVMFFEFRPTVALDLDGGWESYRFQITPVNWQLESGDRVEFNVVPEGERLVESFEIADGVVIPPGSYHWTRYRLEAEIATKRPVSGQVTWWFGSFYGGTLHQVVGTLLTKPTAFLTFEVSGDYNAARLPEGDFHRYLFNGRLQVNFSPDLQWNAFVQYDNESNVVGANTRLRWTFHPLGDLFVVYNHNVADRAGTWRLESNQLLVKAQYAMRL